MNVTILGLDGATWEIIDPLIARGELPGFRALKERGRWNWLETFQPTESVAIWTSIATGVTPTKHGIQTFVRRIPGTDITVPSPGTDRKVPALWNIVSDAGKTVVCVKWFATWPAEKVNGAMLSPRLEFDAGGHETYPPELFAEISHFRNESTMNTIQKAPVKKKRIKNIDFSKPGVLVGKNTAKHKMFDDTSVWKAGEYVYRKYSPNLFMIYLKSIDRIEHFLWGAQDVLNKNNPSPQEVQEAETIFGWYRYFDSIIQELLKDESRLLIVVSDHGMQARDAIRQPYDIRYIDLDIILEKLGFQTRLAPGKTDWNRTDAYVVRAFPYDFTYLVNLNLQEREPNGIIPASAAPEKLKALETALANLATLSGKKVFSRVETNGDISDLICELNRDIQLDDAIRRNKQTTRLARCISAKALPRGIHTKAPPGIIAVIGPNVSRGKLPVTASVLDITPTVLYAMRLPVAEDFDGKVLLDLFDEDFRKHAPVLTIPTYGTRSVPTMLQQTRADDRMKKELKALGYI